MRACGELFEPRNVVVPFDQSRHRPESAHGIFIKRFAGTEFDPVISCKYGPNLVAYTLYQNIDLQLSQTRTGSTRLENRQGPSLCETCKYKNVDFLDFLRSGLRDIDDFANSRPWHRDTGKYR